MHFTVKDILSYPDFQEAVLLTGEKSICSLAIESVSVIEMPVENFVRENELVLTTAIGCGNNVALFLSFVMDIYKSKAAALAIAVGRHVQQIPDEVIAFASKHNFPIIQLPWEIRFSDIIKTIFSDLHKWQENAQKQQDQLQKDLLQLFLNNKPLQEALQLLASNFNLNVYLILQGQEFLQALNGNPSSTTEEIYSLVKEKLFKKPTIKQLNKEIKLQIYPVSIPDYETNYLIIEMDNNVAIQPWSFVQQYVTTLQLWFQKYLTELSNQNKEKDSFIQLLLNGNWASKELLENKGKSLQYDTTLSYVCILGQPENVKQQKVDVVYTSKQLATKLEEITKKISTLIDRKIISSFTREKFVLFIEVDEDACEIANTCLNHFDVFYEKGEIPLFSWGIGDNQAGKYTFHRSYKASMTALEIGRNYKGAGHRSTFANTGMYRLLSSLTKDAATTEMMHTIIGEVASYDNEKGLDLLHTLAVYLKNQCNVSQTSRELSLHRQSLLYRLKKIETLTNRSLSDADDLFLLQLCLRLWSVRFTSEDPIQKIIG